jgi:hypothetical protein
VPGLYRRFPVFRGTGSPAIRVEWLASRSLCSIESLFSAGPLRSLRFRQPHKLLHIS